MLVLNKIFTDHMIFQYGKKIHVSGRSDSNVCIEFNGKKYDGAIRNDGSFDIDMDPVLQYGGSYEMRAKNLDDNLSINDITIGEVFLMSGQSNMQFKMGDGQDEHMIEEDDDIRFFICDHIMFHDGDLEHYRSSDGWVRLRKDGIKYFPSIEYQLACMLKNELDVPIGMVGAFQGASVIESWLPLESCEKFHKYLDLNKKHSDHFDINYSMWNGDATDYRLVFGVAKDLNYRAVCWYQGESDTVIEEAEYYDEELVELVNSWRCDLRDGEMPFIIVQIADFDVRDDEGWHGIQDAQERAVRCIDGSFLVKSRDICDKTNIHPPKKKALSERIKNTVLKLIR